MLLQRPSVSVVIPTLNEAHNLSLVLPYLPLDWIDEVILVDGRSTDGTVDVAKCILPTIKIILEVKSGKGAAMRAGFNAANGDIIVTMDADGSHDPREIPHMVQCLLEGADFVKGSRFAHGGGTTDMPRFRQIGNWALGTVVNLLFNGTYTDLCYGYHAFFRHCLDVVNSANADGFEVDTAIYVRILRNHFRVREVPSFEGYRFYGIGKLQTFPDGWRVLKTIFREWVDHLKTKSSPVYLGFRGHPPVESYELKIGVSMGLLPSKEIIMLQILNEKLIAQPCLENQICCLLQITMDHFNAASGSIVILNDHFEVVEGALSYNGKVQLQPSREMSIMIKDGLAGWVIEHRQAALLPNTISDPRWLRRTWEANEIIRSVISVPLMTRERVFGVLTLAYPKVGQFTQDDLILLTAFAANASNLANTISSQKDLVERLSPIINLQNVSDKSKASFEI